jgi:hypothetical protein
MASQVLVPALFCTLLILNSCEGNRNPGAHLPEKDSLNIHSASSTDSTHQKYSHLISNVPIPFDILNKLNTTGVPFRAALLNSLSNASSYNVNDSKSLNLGVYGADAAYLISMNECTGLAGHVKILKKLADELGITKAFNEDMMGRYNQGNSNKDTLQNVIWSSYTEIDQSLKSNDRLGLASLVVCGGWVESLYLTIQSISSHENEGTYSPLYSLLFAQKEHLTKLIRLMRDFKGDPFQAIVLELKTIESDFGSVTEASKLTWGQASKIAQDITHLRSVIVKGS